MGNPITNELPPTLDNFLQDMCQMYAKEMNYISVSKFAKKATTEDIKALRKLYKKSKEAAEVDDEEEMQDIADEVEKLVLGKDSIKESFEDDYDEEDPFAAEKEGNPYIVGNCSICGAKGTDTVENFLKKYGFEDIDYSCDILDIDPLEEVCEECFKSWLPELNDKTYSEYNDLGIDTRTGLPFGEPFDESVKNKANLKESEVSAYDALQDILKDETLSSTAYTETNEGIEVTFSLEELKSVTGMEGAEAIKYLFHCYGCDEDFTELANEEEFITVEFPYTHKNLTESEENDPTGLSDYQKDLIKEMVQMDFECGQSENDYDELVGLLGEDNDFTGVEEAAASYYMELLNYGPAGFYEEFKDELDFDPDFVAEYGDPEEDDNEEFEESIKNTKKVLTESEEDEMWQAYNTWFDDCDAAYNRHEINDEFMADYNAFEQAYKTASGNNNVEYGSLKDIYDPWYESHAPKYDLSHADHWEAGWKFGKGLM